MKYSITLASFRKIEGLEETLSKLATMEFDALEMFGEPQQDLEKLKDILSSFSMPVCGITGMWGIVSENSWKRKLLSSDPALVQTSEQYVQDCVRMCNSLGGKELNVCLFTDDMPGYDKTHGTIDPIEKERVLSRAIPLLERLCKFANDHGVSLVLEPLNRYSTPYCSTARDAVGIAQKIRSLGVLLDTFHMNIEEDSFEEAIQHSKRFLRHTHFADNNRNMPGFAHIDFREIVASLLNVGYDGYVSFEPNIPNQDYEYSVKKGLDFVKQVERDLLVGNKA